MRKFVVLAALTLALAIPAVTAHAVPSLGVATNVAYVGGTGQTGLEPYQDYFVNTFIPGTDETHGFLVGASGSHLIVFTNWLDTPIYLMWTENIETANNPTINGVGGTAPEGDIGKIDGYRPADYYYVSLGSVSDAWTPLPGPTDDPAGPFTPDKKFTPQSGGGSTEPDFYALAVDLVYTGSIAAGDYFFAIADTDGGGPSGNGNLSPNYDPFSPKTTSATGGNPPVVPEPGTLLLLGSGLIGLAGWGRKRMLK